MLAAVGRLADGSAGGIPTVSGALDAAAGPDAIVSGVVPETAMLDEVDDVPLSGVLALAVAGARTTGGETAGSGVLLHAAIIATAAIRARPRTTCEIRRARPTGFSNNGFFMASRQQITCPNGRSHDRRFGTIGSRRDGPDRGPDTMSEPLHLVDTTMFWSPTGGGVRRYLKTKHAWLATQARWRHTIAVPRVAGSDDAAVALPSLPLPGSGGYRLPVRRRAIARTLVDLAPDVIEAGDPYRVAWGALDAARELGVPAVAYCHSNVVALARFAAGPRFGAAASRAAERYARHVYRGFDLVLAPSLAMTAHLRDWGVERVACQPLGVDSALFHSSRRDPGWRARHGIDASARLVVFAGRFAPEKHLDVIADAVDRLGAPYVFVAIGAGPTPPPRGPRVVVLPFEPSAAALASALASADAFVHAGDQETFGLSPLEAMACGLPIVVRDAEGLGELVDRDNGIAVGDGSPASFADGIAAVFEGDREQRSRAARRRAEASDWQRVLPSLLAHYLRLIAGESAVAAPRRSDAEALQR